MKRKILTLILLAIFVFTSIPVYGAEEKTYLDVFNKDKVIDVNIEIDEDDLQDMYDNAMNEEYHIADITIDGTKVESLEDAFLEREFGENYEDGNLYKMDEGSTLEYREDETYSYADLNVGQDKDYTELKEFVKKLNAAQDGEKGNIESFLDVESALKYIAANTVMCSYDSYNGNMHHNFYLYETPEGVFTVLPWDYNMSFGGFGGGERPEPPEGFDPQKMGAMGDKNSTPKTIRVHVQGHIVKFDNEPVLKSGTTLVCAEEIFEAVGMDITWSDDKKTVTAVKDDLTVELTAGSKEAVVNGEKIRLSAAPESADGNMMVPVRFIAEQLGMKVEWDGSTKLVEITLKK